MHWGKVYDASPAVHTRTHLENNRSWQMMTTYRVNNIGLILINIHFFESFLQRIPKYYKFCPNANQNTSTYLENNRSWQMMTTYRVNHISLVFLRKDEMGVSKVYDASPAVHTRTHLENNRLWKMKTTYTVNHIGLIFMNILF